MGHFMDVCFHFCQVGTDASKRRNVFIKNLTKDFFKLQLALKHNGLGVPVILTCQNGATESQLLHFKCGSIVPGKAVEDSHMGAPNGFSGVR